MLDRVEPLLRLIRAAESRDNYNAIWGKIARVDYPTKPLTEMTIRQILAWQDSIDARYRSEACGAYQFLEDTLRSSYKQAGLQLDDVFGKVAQDKLALVLLKNRGLDEFLRRKISASEFAQNLSKEWASFPCTTVDARGRKSSGQSYYAGDGLNHSLISIPNVLGVLSHVLTGKITAAPKTKEEAPSFSLVQTLLSLLRLLASFINRKGNPNA